MTSDAATWKRRTLLSGLALLALGLAIMAAGSLWAGREAGGDSMDGIWLGTGGVLVLVVGGLMAKWGLFGPLPARFHEVAP